MSFRSFPSRKGKRKDLMVLENLRKVAAYQERKIGELGKSNVTSV